MTSALSPIVLASGEHAEEGGHPVVNELLLEPIWFGVIALVVFVLLMLMLLAFRNTLALQPQAHHGTGRGPTSSSPHGAPTDATGSTPR